MYTCTLYININICKTNVSINRNYAICWVATYIMTLTAMYSGNLIALPPRN